MTSWEKQIEQDKQDRRRSVLFTLNLNNEREEMLKGCISEYGGLSTLPISKKGSEIKEKLQVEKMKVGSLMATIPQKLSTLKDSIGEEPNGEDFIEDADFGYKTYPYEVISNSPETSSRSKSMREYNNCVYKLNSLIKEAKYLNTLMSNLKDDKSYELPARVLSELGF